MRVARNIVFFLGAVFILLFGFPILGLLSALKLSDWLGCSLFARGASECMLWGWDIGERLYVYVIPMIGSLLTPLAFAMGFWDIVLVWAFVVLLLHLLWWFNTKKAHKPVS